MDGKITIISGNGREFYYNKWQNTPPAPPAVPPPDGLAGCIKADGYTPPSNLPTLTQHLCYWTYDDGTVYPTKFYMASPPSGTCTPSTPCGLIMDIHGERGTWKHSSVAVVPNPIFFTLASLVARLFNGRRNAVE